jgi:hypothetical protein
MKTESALLIVGLRSMHGYSVAESDASPAKGVKSLRHQFGQIYDGNSARNSQQTARRIIVSVKIMQETEGHYRQSCNLQPRPGLNSGR